MFPINNKDPQHLSEKSEHNYLTMSQLQFKFLMLTEMLIWFGLVQLSCS